MGPIQSETDTKPKAAIRAICVAGSTLIGIGVLTLAVTHPAVALGMNPLGDSLAATRPESAVAQNLQAASQPPVLGSTSGRRFQPHTSGPLTTRAARNLFSGFAVALDRVREIPSCSTLFEPFATTGFESMISSYYVAPSPVERRDFCGGGVTAFTQVGSRVVRLCPAFDGVDRNTAALLLIHEALHFAGMIESPSAGDAMTAGEINDLVRMACHL